jgi:arginyl-tRNA synthetase
MANLQKLTDIIVDVIEKLSDKQVNRKALNISETKKEFEGDYTLLVFPFAALFGKKPEDAGSLIGEELKKTSDIIEDFNVIKGFLNLTLSDSYWKNSLANIQEEKNYGSGTSTGEKVMIEYSSPNTNKPLHLGHIRNILLGWSVSRILDHAGCEVVRTQIVNDRGIAICKSMLAWQKWAGGVSPSDAGVKGDFFVGDYYVLFDKMLKEEYSQWQSTVQAEEIYRSSSAGLDKETFFSKFKNDYFNEYSSLGNEAREMLISWENKDTDTLKLWRRMNDWVLTGFDETYEKLEVRFDKTYFESETYLSGKDLVEEGLNNGVFFREQDGSVWIDLSDINMDKKIVLRSDGTSVYMTQDIGTAELRYRDFGSEKMVYVVGDEQEYHFKVLFEIMKRLGKPYARGMYHLSYGMVDLPSGKMKSREGNVVDADDLIAEVISEARNSAEERGDLNDAEESEKNEIFRLVGLAALKFFILKVNPKKRMVFNPEESVDLQGQTGPYVQNAYVRIRSILRKTDPQEDYSDYRDYSDINAYEKSIISSLEEFPAIIQQSAREFSPALLANYSYELAKKYHKFYSEFRVISAENAQARNFRINLSIAVSNVLKCAMDLLGIGMPERM